MTRDQRIDRNKVRATRSRTRRQPNLLRALREFHRESMAGGYYQIFNTSETLDDAP